MIDVVRGGWELFALSWRESRYRLVLSVVLMIAQAAAMPLAAPALAALTDAALAGDARGATAAAALVAVAVVAALTAGHFAHIFYFELGDRAVLRLERELIVLSNGSAGLEHHERPEYADKLQVLRQELHRAAWGSMEGLLNSLGLLVAISITAVLLARLNPLLLLLPLAAAPPLLLGRRAESIVNAARERAAPPSRHARHMFGLFGNAASAKELRVGGLGPGFRIRQRHAWDSASEKLWNGERRAVLLRTTGQLIFAVSYVLATLLVVRDAVAGRHSVGDVLLVLTLAGQVNQQVASAVSALQEMQRTTRVMSTMRWVRALLAGMEPPPPDRELPDRIRHGIELRGVSFAYPGTDRAVLADVDLTLPAGTTVAIVGENGAGKTTLIKLLCRFYQATTGVMTLDGTDLTRFDLARWRACIAAGFQDFARFELLARESVGVGELADIKSTEDVRKALRRARAEDILDRLDNGLETQLGKSYADGAELSGGQWQKLALGRAMMRQAPLLLVLDEPTSALDAQAEHELFEQYAAGARRVGQRTGAITVLVSHRFSTVRMADLILVVADGRIKERGSHDELMAAGGLYAELYGMQSAAYA
ncbi:ATP-binding cassette subfamily B protein [Saccharothrix ecbatanensis]|uniref:ATP-binding cassette subfamily B protein n=1 Tax=Saccharothrix ecbatanensis TaxID=1105145 RepID=A0A7W9HDI3_9PSEU|nr:ABC transporter ATP-binding protein [Saccharothrix ecbatanensis]MBB5800283.1 ATP-binding cassette subfamily B protein [Saccharothrix ecbatanensis]